MDPKDFAITKEISIVIPCLNEEETIGRVVAQAHAEIERLGMTGEVLVADNGSSDCSIARASVAGAVICHVGRRGYGAALDGGIRAAVGRIVVFADADCSYSFSNLERLIEPIRSRRADFVIGNRIDGEIELGAMPWLHRYIGTPVLSWIIGVLHGIRTTDCNSGMRALLRENYLVMNMTCCGMEYASELITESARIGARVENVPITFHRDERTRPPHLRRWHDGWRHLRFIIATSRTTAPIILSFIFGFGFSCIAIVLSTVGFESSRVPGIKFHSAFVCAAMGMVLMSLSSMLIATRVCRIPDDRFSQMFGTLVSSGRVIFGATVFFVLAGIQLCLMVGAWMWEGFGAFSDISGLIRLVTFSQLGIALVVGDFLISVTSSGSLSEGQKGAVENKI